MACWRAHASKLWVGTLLMAHIFCGPLALAVDLKPPNSQPPAGQTSTKTKPPLTYWGFEVRVIQALEGTAGYTFKRIYGTAEEKIPVGRNFVIKKDGFSLVGVTVKKVDERSGEFSAEIVRIYSDKPTLVPDTLYSAAYVEQGKLEPKRWALIPNLGLSTVNYSETFSQNYTEILASIGAHAQYLMSLDTWSLESEFNFGFMSFSANQPAVSAKFFNAMLGIGYQFLEHRRPWSFSAVVGGYFTTMWVTNDLFGYSNLHGAVVSLPLRRAYSGGNLLTVTPRIALLTVPSASMGTSNREISFALDWMHPTRENRLLSVGLSYNTLQLTIKTIQISSQSSSFNVGYGW